MQKKLPKEAKRQLEATNRQAGCKLNVAKDKPYSFKTSQKQKIARGQIKVAGDQLKVAGGQTKVARQIKVLSLGKSSWRVQVKQLETRKKQLDAR